MNLLLLIAFSIIWMMNLDSNQESLSWHLLCLFLLSYKNLNHKYHKPNGEAQRKYTDISPSAIF